jgi:hypothetical protein
MVPWFNRPVMRSVISQTRSIEYRLGVTLMKPRTLFVSALVLVHLAPTPSYAYLDPGAGSMLLQLVLGGVAGLVVIVKLYWHRLLAMIGLGKERKEPTGTGTPDA